MGFTRLIIQSRSRVPTVTEVSSSKVEVGDKVIVIGSPLGLSQTVSTGIVSAIRDLSGMKVFQITAPISPGSSGSPVFNEEGEVIGVAFGTIVNGQNINLAVPSGYITFMGN
ncbi:S1C family serine protease [Syntrophothermus lipocalidus]|uniref:S1C family serine protease n=1 Tax=Syntrophothermus lipocalidus TaxID=86170 RepID=UPI0009FDF1AC